MAANERCVLPDLVPEIKGEGEFRGLRSLSNMTTLSDLQAFRNRMGPARSGRPPGFVGAGPQVRRPNRDVHSHGLNMSTGSQDQRPAFAPLK